jgi:cytochrome b subunit of formate dehydrogenase
VSVDCAGLCWSGLYCAVLVWVASVAGMASVASVAGMSGVPGSIHINQLCFFFLIFFYFLLFSLLLLLLPYFLVSFFLFHSIIFVYFIFAYVQNAEPMNSMHSVRKMFHRTERDMKRASEFLSWMSFDRL